MSQEVSLPQAISSSSGTIAAEEYDGMSTAQATVYEGVSSESRTLGQAVSSYVQHRPGRAMLISAAIGLAVALLALPGNSSTSPD